MPPIDAPAEARRRADLLTAIAGGSTLSAVGLSAATYSRWRRVFAAEGLKGLEPKFAKCGRKPLAKLDEWEKSTAKRLYVQTGSVTTALRLMASQPECSEDTAAAILSSSKGVARRSKHSIPRNIRHAIELPAAVMEYHKSPKKVRTNFMVNPRTLTYLNPLGEEVPIEVGDISERDDMSNNYVGWVEWPWGGDPCSDRYGVRIARGQALTQIDVRAVYFQSFCFVVRLRDSYRADDIWQWVGQSYRDMFVPTIGERWERGIWASNKLRGVEIEAGHTPNAERIGGLTALGRRVIESQSPTTKIIENRFNFLQTVSATIPGQIGRRRGEMERENKLWTECREGRRDPREHFLSMTEICQAMETKMHYVNHEPMEGLLYHGVPAEIYERGLRERAERGTAPKPLPPEQGFLFSRSLKFTTCSKAHALVRYTNPDGRRAGWWFHHPELYRSEGEKLAVYFDDQCPSAGATVVPIRPGAKATPLHCELVDGTPQFALGIDIECGRGATAAIDAMERRKVLMNAVRSEYRALGLGSRRLARTSNIQDGAGSSATVEHGIPHTSGRGQRPQPNRVADNPEQACSCADREGNRKSVRTAQPLSENADYMRRLEQQFANANPGVAIT